MTISLVSNGSQLMDGTELNLFASQTTLQHYSTKIFLEDMIANDKITIRIYDIDVNDSTEKIYRTINVVGVQDDPVVLINWIPSSSYRVTCQQTSGTNETITWALYSA